MLNQNPDISPLVPTSTTNSEVKDHRNINSNHIQLIALSATMGNIKELSSWFQAKLYITTYRPVPLVKYIKAGSILYDSNGAKVTDISPLIPPALDPDSIVTLTAEGLLKGQQILIFCSSRLNCQITCQLLIKNLPKVLFLEGISPVRHKQCAVQEEQLLSNRLILIEKLTAVNNVLDPILREGIMHGLAFHHAGLLLV